MRIGVYGDSYASSNSDYAVKWYEVLAEKLQGVNLTKKQTKRPWYSLFKKNSKIESKGEKHTVHNYAFAGSSFFYTYQKFMDTCDENDLNIVLVTDPSRYTKFVTLTSIKFNHVVTGEAHIDGIINIYSGKLTPKDRNTLVYLRGWFKSADYKYQSEAQDAMLDRMEERHSNTIIYPCFADSFRPSRLEKHGLSDLTHMHVMWIRQIELLNHDPNTFSKSETGNLCGHLGPEFNEFFANVVYKRIITGEWNHDGLFDVKLTKPFDYYFLMS